MEEDAVSEKRDVVIAGAGFSGLAMGIKLRQSGRDDFVILERAAEVGGVWELNTYPGCTCDVPSHLYSLSFAPNPNWSHTYSTQPEIRDYLRGVADRFSLRPHIRAGVAVEAATWSEDAQQWTLETSAGRYTCSVFISAVGPLTEPNLPNVPGLSEFEGRLMHSARWDHDYAIDGKRVASIGTGASAIQYVPKIVDRVERLHVFQRTPPWVMPHGDRPIADWERRLYRTVPLAQELVRQGVWASRELLVLGMAKEPRLLGLLERLARSHMEKAISDPELRRRVTPDYTIGCKRLLPSNQWYPALAKPNVELVSGGLAEVRGRTVVGSDGSEAEVDAIILGTGYHVTDIPFADRVQGRDGAILQDAWAGSPRAYLGTSIPGFPNFFMLLGPNTGLGHSSMVYMIESQVAHVLGALTGMAAAGANRIEVRHDAYERFNRQLDGRMQGTVWDTGGCTSFYVDRTGRNATIWPDFTWRFRHRTRQSPLEAYTMSAAQLELMAA
jgi:cation diffusion facilitator CzcD-associated flavoprotein CzcO